MLCTEDQNDNDDAGEQSENSVSGEAYDADVSVNNPDDPDDFVGIDIGDEQNQDVPNFEQPPPGGYPNMYQAPIGPAPPMGPPAGQPGMRWLNTALPVISIMVTISMGQHPVPRRLMEAAFLFFLRRTPPVVRIFSCYEKGISIDLVISLTSYYLLCRDAKPAQAHACVC